MISQIVTKTARREFARALAFEDGIVPDLTPCKPDVARLLYIHIPFCEELCPYCSFHRIRFDAPLAKRYFAALRRELSLYRDRGYTFSGIYAGGGTPTIMMEELAQLLDLASSMFNIQSISVETNPNRLTPQNVSTLRKARVNRLSVGVQTFNDDLLKVIARYDKYGSGVEIAERLAETRGAFDTLNADMIFNFPGQTNQMLEDDLALLLKLDIDQVTFYPLMVSTLTQQLMKETMGSVDFGREKALFKLILRRLEKSYDASSAWCFSRKKRASAMIDEYVVDYEEYAGLGSGAIGFLNGVCYANTFDIEQYISNLEQGNLPLAAARKFDLPDRMRYDFLMKFFSMKLNVDELEKKYDGKFLKTLWKEMIAFTMAGSFRYFSPELRLTESGRYLWVIMMREFFVAVNNFRDYCRKQAGLV